MIKTDKVIYHTRTQEEYDWLNVQVEKGIEYGNSNNMWNTL